MFQAGESLKVIAFLIFSCMLCDNNKLKFDEEFY